MSQADLDLLVKEEHLRGLFEEEDLSPEVSDPHHALVSVYKNTDLFVGTEEQLALLLCQTRLPVQGRCVFTILLLTSSSVVTQMEFLANWQKVTQQCLDGLGKR
jgi:hypothetical protein